MELNNICFKLNSAREFPELFSNLTKEDFDKLAKEFWNLQGEWSKKIILRNLRYNHTSDEEISEREMRWVYKKHIGMYMSDYDYPNFRP